MRLSGIYGRSLARCVLVRRGACVQFPTFAATRPRPCRPTPRQQLQTPPSTASYHNSPRLQNPASTDEPAQQPALTSRPSIAPKPAIDIKHIRQSPDLYAQNCRERNYPAAATYPARINELFAQWKGKQLEGKNLRSRRAHLKGLLANPASSLADANDADDTPVPRDQLIEEGRTIKATLSKIEEVEAQLEAEMEALALALPNLTSEETPRGTEPRVLSYINDHPEPEPALSDRVWRSHVHVGSELKILDFASAGKASGWGWYYLLDEAAQLEQALISYALTAATRSGWRQVSPPSIIYSHIASASGFQPRDENGETQIYTIAQDAADATRRRPELALAGTAEIPLAGMRVDTTLEEGSLPKKHVAVSRCYRAEAGARGVDTKGLYRVHEFTKVELFAWTEPDPDATQDLFDELLDLQTEILGSLGLHCRILEMPTADLGASATRKCDIEAFFPSRRERNDGWGEVTSASICTDYQTRRLATRARLDGKVVYPWTVNGTAMAVPRVLAAILENGWDENEKSVTIPQVLRPWMDGREKIGPRHHAED